MNRHSKQSEFVILRHEVGPKLTRPCGSHFDWMFRFGDVLRTWATQSLAGFDSAVEVSCEPLSDHRLAYLHYEGEIEGNRGSVTRVLTGSFDLLEDGPQRFAAVLSWKDENGRHNAQVTIYRNCLAEVAARTDDSCDGLRLRFAPG